MFKTLFKRKNSSAKSSGRKMNSWQKQALRQRIIAIVGGVTILAVVTMLISGWFFGQYLPVDRHKRVTVIEVSGQKFNMGYYIDALRGYNQLYLEGNSQLLPYILDMTVQNIQQFVLVRDGAAKLGIKVSNAEIDKLRRAYFLPRSQAVRDILEMALLSEKLQDEHFGPQVPDSGDTRDVIAIFLESQRQLESIKAQLNAGADFAELAALFSLDSTTSGNGGALGLHANGVFDYQLGTAGFDDAIFELEPGVWGTFDDADRSKQGGYWLIKIIERNEDNSLAHVSGILLGSIEEAEEIKARLDAGEDFDTLAKEYSQKLNDMSGADLGWVSAADSDVFKDFAMDTSNPVGTVSSPIKDASQTTTGGVWLFKVLSSEIADTTEEDRDYLIGKFFNDWMSELQEAAADTMINHLDTEKRAFAVAQASR
ncbi:MAG: peptidylprolyl isomerase [Dehalococcoidia bacterium]|nr:peptidylprolyl isomerase [Dehalococcoidia bacterium]